MRVDGLPATLRARTDLRRTCASWLLALVALGPARFPPAHAANAESHAQGEELARTSDCFSCHAVDHTVVGPAFDAVAQRYRGQADAAPKLEAKIKAGGSGNWGAVPMTPHPALSHEQLAALVEWVLSLHNASPAPQAGAMRSYSYTLPDGTKATLDFPLFVKGHEITNDVFAGWEQFNSYCFRCHGEDATGSAYAPDLRHSLNAGMTRQQFISTSMAGRPDKGMPTWAGFFTPQEMTQIYEYVKGRSLGLIPTGRPASATG